MNVNYVDEVFNSVDIVIANFVNKNDIVITQDYGLATLVIDKCKVLNYRGLIYDKNNIDFLLENRHTNLKIKKGPKKMTTKDYELLKNNLIKLIEVFK